MVGKQQGAFASGPRFVNPFIRGPRRKSAAHSHINIISPPSEDELPDNTAEPDIFVRRQSLQDEIDVGLAISSKLDTFTSHTQTTSRPRTFAEATMATRPHNAPSSTRTRLVSDEHSDIVADSPVAESFGPARVVLKKKKKASKWQRFDLSGSVSADNEAEDEAISNPASSAPTRASTPLLIFARSKSPPLPPLEPTSTTNSQSATTLPLSQERVATFGHKGKGKAIEEDSDSSALGSEADFEDASNSFEVQTPIVYGSFGRSNTLSDQGYPAGYYATPTQAGYESSLSFGGSEYIDNDPTPRVAQGGFQAFQTQPSLSQDDWSTFDDLDRSDTQSTKDRTEAVLARLNASMLANKGKDVILDDVFDSVDWDPEMPKGPSLTASPEPVPLDPKPVAYTTVGSRVDPSAVPQFSAPNRIQREGANRRPVPLSMMQSRQFDGGFYGQQRGTPPLNLSNSMQYAQQLGRNPSNTMPSSAGSQSSGSTMPRSVSGHMGEQSMDYDRVGGGLRELTEREEKSIAQQLNIQNKFSYESPSYDDASKPVFKVMATVDENRNPYSVRDLLDEDARRRSNSYQGSLQGMDKMQTLQRLSKFDNPMQEACRIRLAELSVKGKSVNGSASLTPYDVAVRDQKVSSSATDQVSFEKLIANMDAGVTGELNRSYQFPPPGLATPQANPLLAAFNSTGSQQAFIPSRPPGYPQPLTAGPPRQRSFPPGLGQIGASQSTSQQSQQTESAVDGTKSKMAMPIGLANTASNYVNAGSMGGAPPLLIENRSYPSTKIHDTLPAQEAMLKYYPNGLPPDFNYKCNPITEENRKLIGEAPPLTAEELAAAKLEEHENWFYQGQRRFVTMKGQDYIEELEMRNKCTDKFGNIAPPRRISHPVIPVEITPEQAKTISTSEATVPLLDASFGTLLAYAEASNSSRSRLSKFVTPAAHLIDTSPTGNESSFGEDWGPPAGPSGSRVSVANSSRASSVAASSRGGGVKISLFDRFNSGKYGKN